MTRNVWLLVSLLLPLAGAILVQFMPESSKGWQKGIALASAIATTIVVVGMLVWMEIHPQSGAAGTLTYAFSIHHSWIPAIGASFTLGLDGVGGWLLALNAVLFLVAIFAVPLKSVARPKLALGLILATEFATSGVLTSLDLLLFYFFWEGMLIPLYFLLGGWGESNRGRATIKFVVYTVTGSLFMLLAILYVAVAHATQAGGGLSFELSSFVTDPLLQGTYAAIIHFTPLQYAFLAFALAFAIKAPLVPFHTWLPDSYEAAPPWILTFFAGIVGKLGLFGFIRFGDVIFPQQMHQFQWLLIGVALLSVIWGALVAITETDLKRIASYASLSHVGFIALGVFALNTVGLTGATMQIVNHGIIIAALFLIIWYIEQRVGTRDRQEIGGLEKRMPWMYAIFLVVTLAALGMPGTNGFAGEFTIMLGAFKVTPWAAVIAGVGVVLACWYMLRLHQGLMHEPLQPAKEDVSDVRRAEGALLVALCVGIIVFGVYPELISHVATGSAEQYVSVASTTPS